MLWHINQIEIDFDQFNFYLYRNVQTEEKGSPRRRIQSVQNSRQNILPGCKTWLSLINIRDL